MRLIAALFCAIATTAAQAEESRIISADGAVTETIIALGAGAQLAGVDTTSPVSYTHLTLPTNREV